MHEPRDVRRRWIATADRREGRTNNWTRKPPRRCGTRALARYPSACDLSRVREAAMRLLRHLLMILAVLSLASHAAGAEGHGHVVTVGGTLAQEATPHQATPHQATPHQATPHHLGLVVAHHEPGDHDCPHHGGGKCCDQACCGTNCFTAHVVEISFLRAVRAEPMAMPSAERRHVSAKSGLPQRPPIFS